MANAVIVVDMQNGFMRPDGTLYCGDHAREIIPRIAARVERERPLGPRCFLPKTATLQTTASLRCFLRTVLKAARRSTSLTNCRRWPKTRRLSKSGATVPFSRPSWPRCWTS